MEQREHSWDALRALLMLLGVPFHAALPYSFGVDVIVESDDPALSAELLGTVLHSFRMGVFFILAGYFAARMLETRGARTWYAGRLRTLGLPLLAGMMFIVPVQLALRAHIAGLETGDAAAATRTLLLTPGTHWTSHLWFLVVLLEFSLVAALAWPRLRQGLLALAQSIAAYPAPVVALVLAPFVILPRLLFAASPFDTEAAAIILDLRRFLEYAPFFALGLMLHLNPGLLAGFTRLNWGVAALAIGSSALFAYADLRGLPAIALAAKAVAGVAWGAVLLGLSRRYFTGRHAVIAWLAGAAFTIYLFHHPLVFLLAFMLEETSFAPELRIAIIVGVAVALSCAIHALVERVPVLMLFLNGRRARPARATAVPGAA